MTSPLFNDLRCLATRLAADAFAVATAESRLVTIRLKPFWLRSRLAIMVIPAAACVAFCSLIGAVLGLVMALTPIVGPLAASAIVLTGGASISAMAMWLSLRRLVRVARSVRILTLIDRGLR